MAPKLNMQLQLPYPAWVVYNHWTGLVDWTGGLDWWTDIFLC